MNPPKKFSDFGIQPKELGFEGEKIKIDRILDKTLSIVHYEIKPSKYPEKGNGKCLQMQIQFSSEKRVVFTGSATLMDMIERVAKTDFPFEAKIIRQNDRFVFQ